MNACLIVEAHEMLTKKQAVFTEEEKEFIYCFAFSSGDRLLTEQLIDELMEAETEREAVVNKYDDRLLAVKSDWVRKIENLLVALEMYRVQEEKALKTMEEVLAAHGVTLTVEELQEVPPQELREQLHKKAAPAR